MEKRKRRFPNEMRWNKEERELASNHFPVHSHRTTQKNHRVVIQREKKRGGRQTEVAARRGKRGTK